MKIDKRDWRHWYYLITSGVYVVLSLAFRPLRPRRRPVVVLYGHKFNGNLKAFADYYAARESKNFELYFATLDPVYYDQLKKENPPVTVLKLTNFKDMIKVSQSSAIITDHGLHTLIILHKLTRIRFINAWHGIGYKKHLASEFSFMDNYSEHWVTSPEFKKIYVDLFGRQSSKIKVTGYARVDRLVRGNYSVEELRSKYSIEKKFKKIVLIAPTWGQDKKGRSVLPFGEQASEFFEKLNKVAAKTGCLIIFRTHLNTKDDFDRASLKNVRFMSYAKYPVAEEFLWLADVLVSDWSSIIFDYLVLDRPTIFLDVSSPYGELTTNEQYRFGEIVSDTEQLAHSIEDYISAPGAYINKYKNRLTSAKRFAYGSTLDGKSAERYYEQLQKLLEK